MSKLFIVILTISLLIGMPGIVLENANAEFGDVINSSSAPEGTQPNGLAWDGDNLWMSSYMQNGGIYKLDPVDGSVLGKYIPSIANIDRYSGLTFDGTCLWVADSSGSGIYKLDPSDGSIISTILSPDQFTIDLAWDGSNLLVYGYPGKKIYKLSPIDGSSIDFYILANVETGQNTALTYGDEHLWLSSDNEIVKLDPSDFTVVSSFEAPCSYPGGLAWDGRHLWVASFDKGTIYQIDISPTVPSIPQNLVAIPHDGFVELIWDAPTNDGGSPITEYNIYRSITSEEEKPLLMTIGSKLSYTDNNVNNSQEYYYQVSAVNSVGKGIKTNEAIVTPTSGRITPSKPLRLEADEFDNYVRLSWYAPEDDGGTSIIKYHIFRSRDTGGNKNIVGIVGDVLTFYDKNVTYNRKYYYHVSAVNYAGEGKKSNDAQIELKKKPINWVAIATLVAAIMTITATCINYFHSRRSKSKKKD
ncbi:MAG: fibronectin type III domain-containing protein [Methanosarcinales archaeon]|nr:fibronectin type III domain-containing protein [Methanosarcinales archaeon]